MKITLIKILHLVLLLLLVVGCLPQEKTTQCGSGEAYNATQRKCVDTLDNDSNSISIASMTPTSSYAISAADVSKSHSVTVSDPFNLGYSIKWYLTSNSGVQTLVSTGLTYTLIHSALSEGSYILEVQLSDSTGTTMVDSRSWTVNVIGEERPEVSSSTASPITTTTSGNAFNLNATIDNGDSLTVDYTWFVNGSSIQTGTFNTDGQALSFNFDPKAGTSYYAGAGVYTVQLVLYEDGTTVTYDTETWTIQNNIPGFASVTLGDFTTNFSETGTTPSTATTIHVFSDYDFYLGDNASNSGMKYDSDLDNFLDQNVDLCVEVDNHTGVESTGVFVDFLYDGVAIPNATGLQFSSGSGLTKCLAQAINDAGASVANTYSTSESDSAIITAVVYDAYSGATTYPAYSGGTEIKRYNWNVNLRALNTAPRITIDTNNSTIGCNANPAASPTSMSGCSMSQYDPSTAATIAATTVQLAITVEDDDYDAHDFTGTDWSHFDVKFKIASTLIDNAAQPVTTPPTVHEYSESDCVHAVDETNNANRYICNFTLLAYDSDGPIDPTGKTYIVEAYVSDRQSPYAAVVSNDSNTVKWTIDSVTRPDFSADNISVANFAANTTGSYLDVPSAVGTPLSVGTTIANPTIKETDKLSFNVSVDSALRDSHYIQVRRCSNSTCASDELVESAQINMNDAENPKVSTITIDISEDAVTGQAAADVYYRVTVAENASEDPIVETDPFFISIANYNVDPTFDTAFNSPAQNTPATPMIAYTGFPITIDPGTISDDSGSDGDDIRYQWAISTDGTTYAAIDGATDKVLVWTPGSQLDFSDQNGEQIYIKLCLGDDGYDNDTAASKDPMDGTDCRSASVDSGDWHFTAFSNMYQGHAYDDDNTGNTSKGEIAVWIDPSTTDPIVKYMAYVNQNNEIVVEKFVLTTDASTFSGQKAGSVGVGGVFEQHSIVFPGASTGLATDVVNLSMSGDTTNGALYLAYQAGVGGVDMVHVRRIDISGGKTGFVHDGKFSYDVDYDGIADQLTVGNDLTEVGYDSNGLYEIRVDDAGDDSDAFMTVTLAGLHGGSDTLTNGVDFCTASCATEAATADSIVAAINSSTLQEFQGVTATRSGTSVLLQGVYETDFLEMDLGATAIGDIMVNQTAGQWMLPYINSNATASNKNKIYMRRGDLGEPLGDNTLVSTLLPTTSASQEVTNDILESDRDGDGTPESSDYILVATRASGTGTVNLYEFDPNLTLTDVDLDIFDDDGVYDIKLTISQTANNERAFIIGRNDTDGLAYARLDHSSGDFDFSSFIYRLKLDDNHALWANNNVEFFDITAGSDENELLLAGVDATNEQAYLIKISGASSISASCDNDGDSTTLANCQPIGTENGDTVFSLNIALGDILPSVTIGSAGGVSGENEQDITVIGYNLDDGGGNANTDAIPTLGLINTKGIELSGDNTTPGDNYNLPYVND
ncbi:MAG: hypothetical protein CME62_10260 [Halobacteriovoraceae bacterium]|nr:hypothetical protein [Halobacteriovoraceae bacterium]|tara:strand:+ start:630 stop:5000 length:4371 start_codon:yes stop_codon:yes gene_type:complete